MLRRCLGSKKLEYTLNTNQGTPDVYVNGVYKGTVSNGVCKWKDSEYKTDVTITLQNCTAGNTYQSHWHVCVSGIVVFIGVFNLN